MTGVIDEKKEGKNGDKIYRVSGYELVRGPNGLNENTVAPLAADPRN